MLQRHRFELRVLEGDQAAGIETYFTRHVTDAIEEEKPTPLIDLEKTVQTETLAGGTVLVPVRGAAASLVPLVLEPESTGGIVSDRAMGKYRFADYLVEGRPYPVKRLVSLDGLATRDLDD